ncbi:MAG: transposase [Chloroflexi bacterium]|nr:transposase [Chloroflexota bacterium]
MRADDAKTLWKRKRKRLDACAYDQPGSVCSVTSAVKDHLPVFTDPAIAVAAVDVLRTHAAKTGTLVYAYGVMPEHIHLIIELLPGATPSPSWASTRIWRNEQRGVAG